MDADKAARGVDSVTDNYVEKESAVNVNVSSFDSTKQENKPEEVVEVSSADVVALSKECMLTREDAHSMLQKNKGNLALAIEHSIFSA